MRLEKVGDVGCYPAGFKIMRNLRPEELPALLPDLLKDVPRDTVVGVTEKATVEKFLAGDITNEHGFGWLNKLALVYAVDPVRLLYYHDSRFLLMEMVERRYVVPQ